MWVEKAGVDVQEGNSQELEYDNSVRRTASNGDWTIQNLLLPHGSKCEGNSMAELVEALVPEECFRFEVSPSRLADPKIKEKCRNEVHIADGSTSWTCGAKCGIGENNGFALFPRRFLVNVTSHIEWYLSRGVEITVVYAMRDRTISMKERLRSDCPALAVARKEDALVRATMKDAYEKYGKHGSLLRSGEKERVVAVSYEGLLELGDAYLLNLYRRVGINSAYVPAFIDENAKFVTDPTTKDSLDAPTLSLRHRKKAEPLHFLPSIFRE